MNNPVPTRHGVDFVRRIWVTGLLLLAMPCAAARSENPISRLARLVNPELVWMEGRYDWLAERISTMAVYYEHPLRSGIGARGHRENPDAPDPQVMVDLRRAHELERIYLVPSQREYIGDTGIFPRFFTLEAATRQDFSDAVMIFSTGRSEFANPQGRPVMFEAEGIRARHLRLTVHRGRNNKGWIDKFGLSEIIAISNKDVVSFAAPVTMTGALDSGGSWYPEALTDGRMPHGIWHAGVRSEERGDAILLDQGAEIISWKLDLGERRAVDRVVLFPYKMTTSFESSVIPNRILVDVRDRSGEEWRTVVVWDNRPASSTCHTPVVLCLDREEASQLRVVAVEPWQLGNLRIHGLSEIEVWSGGENIARGLPVKRVRCQAREEVGSLTNGFSSEHMIAGVAVWLDQLRDRMKFENELEELRPRILAVAEESELNVTLASAVLVGLTFLIPVFFYERRRINVRERIESMRRKIAADLHDDVGGNLGSISLIARAASKHLGKLEASPELVGDLEEVENIARESTQAMRDIVWLLDRRDDSFGDLVERMRDTAGRMLRTVNHEMVCRSRRMNSRLTPDFKRDFHMFFKEALHNILNHSSAENVSTTLEDDANRLVLEITDDGTGMRRETAEDPATARKLRERAAAMGGELTILSTPGQGTRVRLSIHSNILTSPR